MDTPRLDAVALIAPVHMRSFAFLLLLLTASCRHAAQVTQTRSVEAELEQFHSELDRQYRAGDAAGIGRLLTDSAVISPIELPDLRGREAVQSILAGFFGASSVSAYTLQLVEVDVAGPIAFGRGTFVWTSGPRGAAGASRRGRFAAVYQRDETGAWRLHRLIENLLPPSSP